MFPIGVDRVCRRWRLSGDPAPEAPWLEPEGDYLKSHLIEAPFRIGPSFGRDSDRLLQGTIPLACLPQQNRYSLTGHAEQDRDLLHGHALGMQSARLRSAQPRAGP